MKSRLLTVSAVAATLALALAGCTPSSNPAPGDDTEDPGTIRVIGIGTPDFGAVDVQRWVDTMKEAGINVDFKSVEEEDSALRTVVADAADVYIGSLPSLITAVQNADAKAKLIAVNAQATDYVVLSDLSINSLDDLAGKKIGVNTPGSAGDTIMKLALKAEGFDIDSPDYVVIGGSNARVAALQAGQIVATVAHLASAEAAVATGKFKALIYCGPALGAYIQTGLIASDKFLEAHPHTAQLAVNALIDAERWSATNKAGFIELSKTVDTETDDAIREQAYDSFVDIKFFAVNGGMDEDAIDNWIKISQDAGDISTNLPDKSKWLDDSFVKKYLDENGRV
jgi:NitT/TauT family transport system substrate-binding protein